jgi:hypothetical protein
MIPFFGYSIITSLWREQNSIPKQVRELNEVRPSSRQTDDDFHISRKNSIIFWYLSPSQIQLYHILLYGRVFLHDVHLIKIKLCLIHILG